MKKLEVIKKLIVKNRKTLHEQYKIKAIGIFGSYARGKPRKDSDVDILVEFSEVPDFFKFIRLEIALEKLLGANVDLVTRNALKPLIKDAILSEVVFL